MKKLAIVLLSVVIILFSFTPALADNLPSSTDLQVSIIQGNRRNFTVVSYNAGPYYCEAVKVHVYTDPAKIDTVIQSDGLYPFQSTTFDVVVKGQVRAVYASIEGWCDDPDLSNNSAVLYSPKLPAIFMPIVVR